MRRVRHLEINSRTSISELLDQMANAGLGARDLGRAARILEQMRLQDSCFKMIGVAGALVPAGYRGILKEMISSGMVDALVTTGANITHDILESLGESHYIIDEPESDVELGRRGIFRIHNVASTGKSYMKLESYVKKIMRDAKVGEYGSYEVIKLLAGGLGSDSLIKTAVKSGIPIFSPGIVDSVLGVHLWTRGQDRIRLNTLKDIRELVGRIWEKKSAGALLLGGGTPKHFILLAANTASRPLKFAVQITADTEEHGGLSGAKLEEAQSWGKIAPEAHIANIFCDVSIALPLLVLAVLQRIPGTSGRRRHSIHAT